MKAWNQMVRDHKLGSADGRLTWTMWNKIISDAQQRCDMSDYEFVRCLPNALSGYAQASWYLLHNPFVCNGGSDEDTRKIEKRSLRKSAGRQALSWLRSQLFDTSRLHAIEQWNQLKFVALPYQKGGRLNWQVDAFFMKASDRFDSLPDNYRDSTHLLDKLHASFSCYAFYVKCFGCLTLRQNPMRSLDESITETLRTEVG